MRSITNQEGNLTMPSCGEFYADYDNETELWCVFHTENNKAYSAHMSKEEAENNARCRNEQNRGVVILK